MFSRQSDESPKAFEHLANQRTSLAWIATGVSIVTFGFVIALFDDLLDELGLKTAPHPPSPSFTLLSGALLIFGLLLVVEAFFRAFRISHAIDEGCFRPGAWYPVVVTWIACLLGLFVALALWVTG
jgi:inner membrane protein YidH